MLQNRELLSSSKNLLAFSAGVDSTTLLFLLLENKIPFDIAIVDYGLREQSKDEVAYAQELALKYGFTCYVHKAEPIEKNFEANARAIRYNLFEKLIEEHNYTTLLTAHHLGDRLEWMLMQLCKGAGAVELAGMSSLEKREGYTLVRPLLSHDKEDFLAYLNKHTIRYFIDESNSDEKYKRNVFRHKYAGPLLEKYKKGIKKSFEYLDEDRESLIEELHFSQINEFFYTKASSSQRSNILAIDKHFKSQGHLITAQEKEQLKNTTVVIISRKFVVNQEHGFLFIAPYMQKGSIEKRVKEKLRLLRVTPKLRSYLASDTEVLTLVSRLLQ